MICIKFYLLSIVIQVVFANSSISGLLVVVGLCVADTAMCAAGLLAATLATLTALVRRNY